ncbi:CHAT domain-containing protein [Bacteroidales bacterium OttesenSCG-928-I14]|nr:CHAT domain-containing protein [Bacteroidales bacterium OttesenSCG-928-I14]
MKRIVGIFFFFFLLTTVYGNAPFQQIEKLVDNGELTKAISLLQTTLDANMLDHPNHSLALHELGKIYYRQGEYEQAKIVLSQAMEEREALFGKKSLEYTESLLEWGYLQALMYKMADALKSIQEAVDLRREVFGNTSIEYADALLHLAQGYIYTGNVVGLKATVEEAAALILDNPKSTKLLEARYYEKKGYLDFYSANYAGAYENIGKGMELWKEENGEKHPYYLAMYVSYLQIAPESQSKENNKEEMKALLQTLDETVGRKSAIYASNKNNLARIYFQDIKYAEAEILFRELVDEANIFFKDTDYYYRLLDSPMSGLAVLYNQLGRYQEALEIYRETLAWQEKIYDKNNYYLLVTLNNLGTCYFRMRNIAKAERYFEELLTRINNNERAKNDLIYPGCMLNLAVLYNAKKEFDKALELLEQLGAWVDGRLPESNTFYTNYLHILTMVKAALNPKDDSLEELLLKNRRIQEERIGRSSMYFISRQHNLAVYYRNRGENTKAWELFEEEMEIMDNMENVDQAHYITLLFEMAMTKRQMGDVKKAGKLYQQALDKMQTFVQTSFSLFSYKEREEFWLDFIPYFDFFQEFTYQNSPKFTEVIEIGYNAELFSKSLLLYIHQLQRQQDRDTLTLPELKWEDVKTCLNSEEAAVEFIHFTDWHKKSYYAAYLLRHDYKRPVFLRLGSEQELMDMLKNGQNDKLYKTVWQPLEKYLEGVNEVYIAPAGLLNKVSFAGMKSGKDYLIERYNIHHLLSTRDLISLKEKPSDSFLDHTAALFGGADFGLPASELADLNLTRGQGFAFLPGSKEEVEIIAQQLSEQNWNIDIYIDTQATEEEFKQLSSRSPHIIHISTHGFYLPESGRKSLFVEDESLNPLRYVDNPMKRSGLVFTGANHAWLDEESETGEDEGILTAYEVSQMDLSNTELVVLSACKTGLGDLVAGEGVYGLQRAFRLAGVKALIVSIWDVSDKDTVELMKAFYSELSAGKNINQAFTSAQKGMQKKYPKEPEKWAGFVLIN